MLGTLGGLNTSPPIVTSAVDAGAVVGFPVPVPVNPPIPDPVPTPIPVSAIPGLPGGTRVDF